MRDGDRVDVATGTSYLNGFAWTVGVVGMAVVFHATLAVEDEHALCVGELESLMIRLWWCMHVAIDALARLEARAGTLILLS